ncbi:YdeI/OmpD-associated family protein [Tunturibacter empetritectus]|uniref:YdeI/OmpD-associated family protein n=1 Tax=Tunturiibacter empetritectus TaxID=3069691 RepID=A0AAU7ZJ09_9BACT
MPAENFNPRVDMYVAKSKPFAQPILEHLRELIHKACPNVQESIKWSMPFFEYGGVNLGNMAAFKEHCSFGFWGKEISAVLHEAGIVQRGGMGNLGRITTVKDLPSDKQMLFFIRQATGFIDRGEYTSPMAAKNKLVKPPKPAIEDPAELTAALKKNKKAAAVFASFSPSCKREYTEWIADAKRPETREKRIATAIEWIAEGKQRNWKYQNC